MLFKVLFLRLRAQILGITYAAAVEHTLVLPDKEALTLEVVAFDKINKLIHFNWLCSNPFLLCTESTKVKL